MSKEASGDAAESNVLKDQWGREHDWDAERYPDGSPAKEGNITKPSGQGGTTPKARPDHQDMFPANPEPSEHARAKGEENDRVARGEVSFLTGEPVGKAQPAKTTTTTTTKEQTK